jgi:DNA-binding GntR family transcriptional regulator
MPKIVTEKLSNKVYLVLKEMIANYRFQPGTRLNVEQLTKELGVSRTPVWEAINRLEQEGLLETIPNRGVFMTVLTPQNSLQLYQVREVLESMAGGLAATLIKNKTLKKMEKCLEKQIKAIEKSDLEGYSRSDFEFHAFVYESCGNSYLQEFLEDIKNKIRPITFHIEPILSRLYEDHVEIFNSLKTKDPSKAEAAFRRHNRKMIEQIEKSIKTNSWKQLGEEK